MAAVSHADRNMGSILGPPFLRKKKTLTIHFNKACRPDMRRAESCVIVGVPVAICIVCIESFWFQLLSRVESVRFITSGGGHVCRRPGATRPLRLRTGGVCR